WRDEPALASLGSSNSKPLYLVVGLEGTAAEVESMIGNLTAEWHDAHIEEPLVVGEGATLWRRLVEFPAAGDSPLVLKANVVPSGTLAIMEAALRIDSECSIQAHAGTGVVIMKFAKFPEQGLSRALVGELQPVAAAHHGQTIVLSNPSGAEMNHQSMWVATDAPLDLMTEVKRRFDPRDILNRGRFVYVRTWCGAEESCRVLSKNPKLCLRRLPRLGCPQSARRPAVRLTEIPPRPSTTSCHS